MNFESFDDKNIDIELEEKDKREPSNDKYDDLRKKQSQENKKFTSKDNNNENHHSFNDKNSSIVKQEEQIQKENKDYNTLDESVSATLVYIQKV